MSRRINQIALLALGLSLPLFASGCASSARQPVAVPWPPPAAAAPADTPHLPEHESATARKVALAAMNQVGETTSYDPNYYKIGYPGGDVPISTGVCSDVVVRAFRAVGVDLQVKLHEDMLAHFSAYPQTWGLSKPDPSIDQRRVPNLQTYFTRHHASLKVTGNDEDYWPGDVVTWSVNGRPHTGIVSTTPTPDGVRFMMVHNIGAGTQIEDVLFAYRITGHYRSF